MTTQPPPSAQPTIARVACWAVALGVGGLLVLAAGLKVLAPASFVAVVAYLLPRGLHEQVFRVGASTVVAWEAFLGLALILAPRRRPVIAAAIATITLFTGALLYLAAQPGSPSCSCFGPLGVARRAGLDVGFGATRNAAILVSLVWLWTQSPPRAHTTPPAQSARPIVPDRAGADLAADDLAGPNAPRGFTLIELLVVIAIVCLVLCFTIPALRGSRRQAMLAATLATHRQLLAGLNLYAAEHDGHLPYLARRGQPFAPVEVGSEGTGHNVSWHGYFRDQSQHWHTLVNPDYIGLPADTLAIPDSLNASGNTAFGAGGLLWGVRYHLTHTAFAAPALWVEHAGENGGLDLALLRGMRLADLHAPSHKGLLIDVALGWHNPAGDPLGRPHMPVGWGDGSASTLDLSTPNHERFIAMPPLGGNGQPVWATTDGFNGRDRE